MSIVLSFILAFGYIGVFVTLFAESGFFLGFFLPGDSLLFTAGLLASTGHLYLTILLPIAAIASIIGDSLGYWTGATFGRHFLERHTGRFLKHQYLEDTEKFFARYGGPAIFLARFVPIVRTFTPIFAGIGEMRYGTFLAYNIAGGILWTAGLLTLSFYLGRISFVKHYTSLIIVGIIVISLVPVVLGWFQAMRKRARTDDKNQINSYGQQ